MRLLVSLLPALVLLVAAAFLARPAHARNVDQTVTTLIVEIRTLDERFAGTDDAVHLQIGGRDFPLDDPNRDDFERNHTDRFEFDLSAAPLDLEIVRGVGQISVTKIEDSFFGGGWGLRGITIWANSTDTDPIYQNATVHKWLDGDDLEWTTSLGDPGWNVPEPPPFPPCSGTIIIFAAPGQPRPAAGDADTDSDCDGTPDNQDDTFDTPPDSDGDGLPDLYETQTGSNPNDPDSDHDGWADGRNRRSMLVLTRIECDDEDEDIGSDELYLTSEDVRYPKSFDLDGYWAMNDGNVRSPGVIVDVRTLPANTPALFSSRMKLRESDFRIFEKPTDDTFRTFDLEWDDDGSATIEHDDGDAHYKLTFRWFSVNVRDPAPTSDSDNDGDGLPESKEAEMSLQSPSVQRIQIAGHNGLADPAHRELWVEVDHSGTDQALMFDAKQMVASQFAYHDIFPRFDDGWFGNDNDGELPYVETLTPADLVAFRNDDTKFWHERRNLPGPGGTPRGVFRYALLADHIEHAAGAFGEARCDGGCRFIISGVPLLGHTLIASAQPIIFMHELGHTLTLCHRVGDKDPQNPPTCPAAPGVRCADFCAIGQESTTAMGSEQRGDIINPIVAGATTGIGAGVVIGGLIGGTPGAIVGGIVGGIVGSITGVVLGADFYARDIDYHIREWAKLHVEPR